MQLPGLGAGGPMVHERMQPYQAPSAAAAAEAALQLPGARGPRSEALDAFFPQGPLQAGPPDFAEFESIYGGASHHGQSGPPVHMTPQAAVAPFFKVRADLDRGWSTAGLGTPSSIGTAPGCFMHICCVPSPVDPCACFSLNPHRLSWTAAKLPCRFTPCPCLPSRCLWETRCVS